VTHADPTPRRAGWTAGPDGRRRRAAAPGFPPRPPPRSPPASLALMSRPPPCEQVDREQQAHGDEQEQHRPRGGARVVTGLDAPEYVDRRGLGLERDVPRDQ